MRINYKEGQGNVRMNYVTILHIIGKINIVIVNTPLTADHYISHDDLLRLMLEFLNHSLYVTYRFSSHCSWQSCSHLLTWNKGFWCKVLRVECPSWCQPAQTDAGLHLFCIQYDFWRKGRHTFLREIQRQCPSLCCISWGKISTKF